MHNETEEQQDENMEEHAGESEMQRMQQTIDHQTAYISALEARIAELVPLVCETPRRPNSKHLICCYRLTLSEVLLASVTLESTNVIV